MEIIVDPNSWARAAIGGALIGLAAALMFLGNGRIAGVSGVLGGLVFDRKGAEAPWRTLFLASMVFGALVVSLVNPALAGGELQRGWLGMLAAGLLVGFGVRMGGGCTSGHGVCGIARFSTRSILATCTFMASGVITVMIARHVFGAMS